MKSDLFIECAKNVVDFYNLTQESIGSKNRMEYPVVKEVKPREWWQILDRRSWYTYGNRFETKKEAEKYAEQLNNDGSLEIIKVREVIE